MNTLLAVDSNFLMHLAEPRDAAHDALEVIRRRLRETQIFVMPTVLDELGSLARKASSPADRACAKRALAGLRAWGMSAVEMDDFQDTVAGLVAKKLLEEGIIPLEERNDARIVGEAAVLGCQLLISSDGHVRDADAARLAVALGECQLAAVVVRRPQEIVREFARRR